METKTYIYIGIFIGSTVGSVLGGLLDKGNFFGFWSIVLGTVGGVIGIWAGYKLANQ